MGGDRTGRSEVSWKLLRLRLRSPATDARPTNLELFFDLVFVVVISQLSAFLAADPTAKRFLEYFGLFVAVWFTWAAFTAYADRFDVDDTPHRIVVLGAALANIVAAIHVDDAFSGGSEPFALAAIAARVMLLAVTDRARRAIPEARRFQTSYEVGWGIGLALWVVSLAVPTPARYAVWAGAVAVEVATPLVSMLGTRTVPLVGSHIAERFGLFTIIVLGESMLSVAAGIATIDFELASSLAAVGMFVVAALLWWLYFDCVTTAHAVSAWFTYIHAAVYAGLGTVAPGALLAIQEADDATLSAGARAALCGGIAVFLLALCFIELTSRPPPAAQRRAAARAVVGVAVLGLAYAGAALLLAELAFELVTLRRSSPG
jgi:low temperature requirement protein LtrA